MLSAKLILGFAAFALGQKACTPVQGTTPEAPGPNDNTTPPEGALVVGPNSTYTTIQSAVDALTDTTEEQIIFINPGTYAEQVRINQTSGPLSIYGYTKDTSSYEGNTVTITAGESQETQPNNDATATLSVHTTNFKLYNVDVVNSFGIGSQAVALSSQATNQGYYGIALYGYQDTLLANVGNQIFGVSLISGATDFVFGMRASVWFDQVDVRVVEAPSGGSYITASGRQTDDANWYVFNNGTIAALEGELVEEGSYYLGRPWRNYSRVVFQLTEMSEVVKPEGWSIWNVGDERTAFVTYGEFENTGPGSEGERADFAVELCDAVDATTVLGEGWEDEYYVDADYLS